MPRLRIGILTGGGDVPGLNSVIKEVTYRAPKTIARFTVSAAAGRGLTHVNLDDPASKENYIRPLSRENTRTIDRFGGTVLHSSRTNHRRCASCPVSLRRRFPEERRDMGHEQTGDRQSLQAETRLPDRDRRRRHAELRREARQTRRQGHRHPEDHGQRRPQHEYCIGFSTAITRATAAIGDSAAPIGSHERIGIFRVFGRDAGYTALYTAYVTAIRCCIPEFTVNLEKLIDPAAY
jgi:6-phosphofructokinase 1